MILKLDEYRMQRPHLQLLERATDERISCKKIYMVRVRSSASRDPEIRRKRIRECLLKEGDHQSGPGDQRRFPSMILQKPGHCKILSFSSPAAEKDICFTDIKEIIFQITGEEKPA